MKLFLTYNRIVGNTFFGWTYHGEKICKCKVLFYRIWNIAIVCGICYFSYQDMLKLYKTYTLNSSDVKINLVNILQLVSIVGINVQTFLSAIYLLIFGGKMFEILLKPYGLVVNKKFEAKATRLITTSVIAYSLFCSLINAYSASLHSPGNFFSSIVPMYLFTSTQITILSFIAYKSFLVKHFLVNNLNHTMNTLNKLVLNLDQSLKKLDSYVSLYILVILLFNEIYCVSSICKLAIDYKSTLFDNCLFLFHGLTNLVVLCYCCDIIPSSLTKILDHHETNINTYYDRILMLQMRQLNDRIGFTAFELFLVKANTLLSCLGLIISYSVIIIQTGRQC